MTFWGCITSIQWKSDFWSDDGPWSHASAALQKQRLTVTLGWLRGLWGSSTAATWCLWKPPTHIPWRDRTERGECGLLFYSRWHSICSCSTPSYVAVTPPVTHSSFKQKFGHHRCIVWISLVARSFCTWGNIALTGNFRGFKQQSLSWCVIWTWVKRTFVISCGGVLYSKCLRLIKYFFNMSPQPQLIETFQGFFSSYLGIYVLTVKFINIHTPLKMMTLFLQT